MEKKKNFNAFKICRFCLTQDESLTSIYEKATSNNSISLALKILNAISIEVFPSDKMPNFICSRCRLFVDICHEFKQFCRLADETIMGHMTMGKMLTTIKWPELLTQVNMGSTKTTQKAKQIIKTVIDGGAVVEVTPQETDSEDENTNVYNVKIGDSSSKGACVKVMKNNEKVKMTKEKNKESVKEPAVKSLKIRHPQNDRPYTCKYCKKSFINPSHRTRHIRLKHHETIRTSRGPFGEADAFHCDQCEDTFTTQDELIYHSAIHATQNLICPLCQEKFHSVDAVTAHIKSHVNGTEFMCELCELVFTSRKKLDTHIVNTHVEEMQQGQEMDDSSNEADFDNGHINVKEEEDHMLVEINNPDEYMFSTEDDMDKKDVNFEESGEASATYTELSTVDTLALVKSEQILPKARLSNAAGQNTKAPSGRSLDKSSQQTASILRKVEQIKRRTVAQPAESSDNKDKPNNGNSVGASDKSLRLLEKELQDLKRTNTRNEVTKNSTKNAETSKTKRAPLQISTSKPRAAEERKPQTFARVQTLEKRLPDKRPMIKEMKDTKNNGNEELEKDSKDKNVMKNGGAEKSASDEGIRRSTRPSKIKDYAKMIRDRTQAEEADEDDSDDSDDEYKEDSDEARQRSRRMMPKASTKVTPAPTSVVAPEPASSPPAGLTPRKRGRPRKDQTKQQVPAKIKKEEPSEETEEPESQTEEKSKDIPLAELTPVSVQNVEPKTAPERPVLVTPTGQTLKKIPIQSLPPGLKPMPAPPILLPNTSGEVQQMQIGSKVMKVKKIVMTKAEVDKMAEKGLVEFKDGTMVLKQRIKVPKNSDLNSIKSSLVGDADAVGEMSPKKEKAAPTRCDLNEDT